MKRTRRTETSKYPEEKKSNEIPLVAASEKGEAQNYNQHYLLEEQSGNTGNKR